jgi:GcrA cell cycle regulator
MTGQTIDATGWTDERTTTAKRLWLDGLSASQIARQLGGVTRNAVIGKMNRLGLSRSPEANAATFGQGERVRSRLCAPRQPLADRSPPVVRAEVERPAGPLHQAPELVRVFGLDQLDKRACKWPIGDPLSQGFGFCGGRCALGDSYCAGHKTQARQSGQERNPQRIVRDLERGLRRYLA